MENGQIEKNKKTVLIGLSGGVDSAVAAHLLQKQGYEVTGITYIMSEKHKASINDAQQIADLLGIKLLIRDLADSFNNDIVSYFISSYMNGDVPNPCVLCNSVFKFKNLIEKADELKIHNVATGHYVISGFDEKTERFYLKKAVDEKKDQSYFLYALSQHQLARALFPLGNLTKQEVRRIAQDINIPVSHKKDSQDICFIQNNDYAGFIKERLHIDLKQSTYMDEQNNILGKGAHHINFTPGQRRGLKKGFNDRMYVIRKDATDNIVVLGPEKSLYTDEIYIKDINLMNEKDICEKRKVKVKIRNTMQPVDAYISSHDDCMHIEFLTPVRAAVNGQSAVFYDNDILIGGGIIHGAL